MLRAITAWNIRPSTDRAASAAFALEVLLPALPDALEALAVVLPEVALLVLGVIPAGEEDDEEDEDEEEEGATVEADAVVGVDTADVVEFGVVPAADADAEVGPPDGGGLASPGLVSAPVPQGMGLPSG
jgi:hypothetical protein